MEHTREMSDRERAIRAELAANVEIEKEDLEFLLSELKANRVSVNVLEAYIKKSIPKRDTDSLRIVTLHNPAPRVN